MSGDEISGGGDVFKADEVSIVTPRLVLRVYAEDDLADVHAFRSDPEVARFMGFSPETLEESRTWLSEVIFHNRKRPRQAYNLAIAHRTENRVIGWIGIGDSERYPDDGELGFGYMLHRAHWGHGYATEAVRAILGFGFDTLGGRRISAWCYADNRASARVLEKAGLRLVKRYQDVVPKSGRGVECLEFEIGADEYRRAASGE